MRILITGASGFVGSHLVDIALEKGYEVFAGVREGSNRQYLTDDRIKFVLTDLNQLDEVESEFRSLSEHGLFFDYVIHNAGVTKADNSEGFMQGNAYLSEAFFKLVIKYHPRIKTLVYISSMAASGPGGEDMVSIKYGDLDQPMTPYGKSKKRGEELLRALGANHLIFRPTAIYGPRESKMLPLVKILMKGMEPDFSDRRQRLSFIHVSDLAEAIYLALDKGLKSRTYLVSDGLDYSLQEYRSIIKNYLDLRTFPLRISPVLFRGIVVILNKLTGIFGNRMHLTPEKVDDMTAINWKVDISELEKDVNFKPEYNLEKGLQHALDWYIKNGWI